ncbi:MAG: divergent polysaccharide deacetylase family protein [Pseudomonadales bacterium]
MKRLIIIIFMWIPVAPLYAAHVAVIIDDLGHNLARGTRAIELPGPATVSILPYAEHSRSLAETAHQQGKEVMLHLPMANLSNLPIGPRGLDAALSIEDFYERLSGAFAHVPHARGINNHMGSYLTQQPREMSWLMDELHQRQLFFIDSRTTPHTVASQVARKANILTASRDVFLDNTQTFYQVDRAFKHLINIANKKGTAIAIAHPHDVTLHYLEMTLPLLKDEGVTILPVSELLVLRYNQIIPVRTNDPDYARYPLNDKAQSLQPDQETLHK